MNHITTFTGKKIDLFNMVLGDIDIHDIAHALACVNRFGGHARKPINVAQHSVYVARFCQDTPYELQALLHDASEAYLGDMTHWLKNSPEMKPFLDLETKIQRLIYQRFNCSVTMNPKVLLADKIMACFEGSKGYKNFNVSSAYHILTEEEIKKVGKWAPWPWAVSEDIFLTHFRQLTRDENHYEPEYGD